MRGHERLIEARINRKSVDGVVFINDYPCKTDWVNWGDSVTVCTVGDIVQTLDLRFLIGLKVSISSQSEIRAKALFEKCKASGAEVVAACHVQPDKRVFEQSGWCEMWRKENAVH